MPKISVIVPIYNAEKYLVKCLDSIRNQTLQDIEIICIDDGSTDGSGRIADDYARMDARIKVEHWSNEGSNVARKHGVSAAHGEYIGFVDADDYIAPEMYEKLFAIAEQYGVDMITCGHICEGKYLTKITDSLPEGLYYGERLEYLRENAIFDMQKHEIGIRKALWSKLFKKEMIQRAFRFTSDKLSYAEDAVCVLNTLLRADSVYISYDMDYHYVIHPDSMTQCGNPRYLEAVSEVYKAFLQMYEHPNFTDGMRLQAEIYMTDLLFRGINIRMGFRYKNMMRTDPYWIDRIPQNSSVALCGAGEFGQIYKRTLDTRKDIRFVACADENPGRFPPAAYGDLGRIISFDELAGLQFDYAVITVKNPDKAQELRERLSEQIPDEKILWFKQEEVYWRYVEANLDIEKVRNGSW